MNPEEKEATLKYNKEMMDIPPPSAAEREAFIKWLDSIQAISMHVFFAAAPDELWNDVEVFSFTLIGQPNRNHAKLPRGIYCIDVPAIFNPELRDPIAQAFAYLGKAPDDINYVPTALSVVLPKPTAHERFAAKMFFRQLINSNSDNQDLCEWASKLK